MTELDSLFGCVWREEAPIEALTDWLIQNAGGVQRAQYRYCAPTDGLDNVAVLLVNTTQPDLWPVVFEVPYLEMRESKMIWSSQFPTLFPKWLPEQIEWLYYVLSK